MSSVRASSVVWTPFLPVFSGVFFVFNLFSLIFIKRLKFSNDNYGSLIDGKVFFEIFKIFLTFMCYLLSFKNIFMCFDILPV